MIKEILAAFRSRNQALEFAELLRNYGVSNRVVNTPREAHVGCGLSVRYDGAMQPRVRALLAAMRPGSFAGFFTATGYGANTVYRPLS